MDEQETQWSDDCEDFVRLARVSQLASMQTVDQAIERGIQDYEDARTIYEEERTVYKMDHQKVCPPRQPIRKESVRSIIIRKDIRGPSRQ